MFKEELYEQFILAESKSDFISSLIPDSESALYFKVLNDLNTQGYLSQESQQSLLKLQESPSLNRHQGYGLHCLDFLRIVRILDSADSSQSQREKALVDLKHYFGQVQFNETKPYIIPQGGENDSAVDNQTTLRSVLDDEIINFSNYLNLAYTNLHNLQNLAPQCLFQLDTARLLKEAPLYKDYNKILETFLSNVPCLHQVKDVPLIYKALYDSYKSRKHIYEFNQAGYDRLTITQLSELGVVMREEVFETAEFQLALIKKLFYKDLSVFKNKDLTQLSKEEKTNKKQQYLKVYEWTKDNLPNKLKSLTSLLIQELAVLNLDLDIYDQEVFMNYISNPPNVGSSFTPTRRELFKKEPPQISPNWECVFQFESVSKEKQVQILEQYLFKFLRNNDSIKPFDSYLAENFLEKTLLKSKILSGQQQFIANASAVLRKYDFDILIDSRSIRILDNNERYVKGHEEVKLVVEIKNIQNLILNVFEVKTENYYISKRAPFDNQINLDGLIPIHSSEFTYKEPSNQAVRRVFSFELIQNAKRGVFIVEFFGNSISSRAVFKKGLLTIIDTPTIAGHLICIVDEEQNICKPTAEAKTGIWLSDRFHSANEDGQIIIPYQQTSSQSFQVIAVHGEFAELSNLTLLTEQYSFNCTYMYNQESFLLGSKAKILIHVSLNLNGLAASMSLIEEQIIKVNIRNHQDIPTILEFRDIKFDPLNDIEIEVPIQSIVKSLDIECSGVIRKMDGSTQSLLHSNQITFELHQEPANQIFELYLQQNRTQGYVVLALDKTGQPIEGIPVYFQFTHKKITETFQTTLQTDEKGRITLGQLENIKSIVVTMEEFQNYPRIDQSWNIEGTYKAELPNQIIILEDELIEVPLSENTSLSRENFTFYSLNQINGQFFVYEDLFDILTKKGSFIQINNLKEGAYVLNLLDDLSFITIQVYKGQYWHQNPSYLVANNTFIPVERKKGKLITIKEVLIVPQNEKKANVIVNLNLPSDLSSSERKKLRVHIFCKTFLEKEQSKFMASLRNSRASPSLQQVDLRSFPASFFNNKKIGDEECYVYQRKGEEKRIGNALEKPCVLLKRTFNRDTNFDKEKLAADVTYSTSSVARKPISRCMAQINDSCLSRNLGGKRTRCHGGLHFVRGEIDTFMNFLNYSCFVSASNLVSNEGQVIIPELEWNHYSSIQVVVVSENMAICNSFPTNQVSITTQDLRHQSSMKPDELYTENLSSGQLLRGKQHVISADSQTAVIGSIPELFEIQKVLMKTGRRTDEYLGKAYGTWAFLKEWTGFNDRQKLEKYNEFASHELNLFLYFKDTAFFKMVVAPFIRNKLQKQFLDLFLLEDQKRMEEFASTERINELNVLELVLLILTLVKNDKKQKASNLNNFIENNLKSPGKNTKLQKRLFLTIIESSSKEEQQQTVEDYKKDSQDLEELVSPCGNYLMKKKRKQFKKKYDVSKKDEQENEEEDDEKEELEQNIQIEEERLKMQRKELKVGYKKLDKTVEYVERNYFGDNKTDNYSNLVTVNPFWVDLAKHVFSYGSLANFVSENFIFAFNNHVEALSVLALMDLSFSARDNYDISNQPGRKIQITAKNNVLFFSKEILKSTEISKANVSIIQTFFDPYDKLTTLKDDPTVQIEKEVEEFLVNKIYGTKVIITNTSIANLNLQVLSEIPSGSIPVNSFEYTKSIDVLVNSYQTVNTLEFFFYFPKPGSYTVYRSNASRNGRVVAQAAQIPAIVVKAVPEIRKIENLSDILNNGSKEDILNFARTSNLCDESSFKLSQIYYLFQSDKDFLIRFQDILREQGLFVGRVWEYSLLHNYEKGILELLNNVNYRHNNLEQSYSKIYSYQGSYVSVDNFTPFEYHPLLTSRAHSFMNQNKSKILNVEFKQTYADYLAYLAHVPQPTGKHYLLLCYYLLLQERIEEALTVFSRISKAALDDGEAAIQRDYLSAYLDIYTGGPNFKLAREISERYLEYPIISWRNLFVNLSNQLAEYDGYLPEESEQIDNTDLSTNLKNAEKEQSVSIEIKDKQLVVLYQNVDSAEINFYQLDLEVLFSTQPFMLDSGDRREFTFVKPNASVKLTLPKSTSLEKKIIDIPSHLAKKNLYIQLVSAAEVQSLSYFSSSLKAQILDKFGQVKVTDESNSPLQKVYVKCFAKYEDDSVAFFRDGYTDLRGRFDYALSSVNDITEVNQFSIFICSEEHGALIRECLPPSTHNRMETTITLLSKKK